MNQKMVPAEYMPKEMVLIVCAVLSRQDVREEQIPPLVHWGLIGRGCQGEGKVPSATNTLCCYVCQGRGGEYRAVLARVADADVACR